MIFRYFLAMMTLISFGLNANMITMIVMEHENVSMLGNIMAIGLLIGIASTSIYVAKLILYNK